ncbi:Protein SQRD-1 b, partial [Aphelenchoides avenae]
HYRIIVAGGGAGGLAVASKFASRLPAKQLCVIEPLKTHTYQPGLTLAAAGLMEFDKLFREEGSLMPKRSCWIPQSIAKFDPRRDSVTLSDGRELKYDFLVIATGLELRYDLIEGLSEALSLSKRGICSIYHSEYAKKTYEDLQRFEGGNAIFTFPNTPIKCPGALQKICYLAEEYFRKNGKRQNTKVIYNTSLGKIFGVEKYANELMKIVEQRDIQLNTRLNLTKVETGQRIATFEVLDEAAKPTGQTKQFEATDDKDPLVDSNGWVRVDPKTLRALDYDNVFAIGDCANTPNAKTAAAVSSQFRALKRNLQAALDGVQPTAEYDGYASCPLVVDSKHVILAEFNGAGPLETLPIDQSKPSRLSYYLKRYAMPALYWNFLIRGRWSGPSTLRKVLHLGMSK